MPNKRWEATIHAHNNERKINYIRKTDSALPLPTVCAIPDNVYRARTGFASTNGMVAHVTIGEQGTNTLHLLMHLAAPSGPIRHRSSSGL